MNEKGRNNQQLKKSNYQLIKKYIYKNSPVSRVEVAQNLSLTTPTITGMVTPMLSRGVLREIESAASEEGKNAGRPRVMLEFVPTAYYICGVEIGPYRIIYQMTDMQGRVVASRQTNETLGEYERVLDILSREIPMFIQDNNLSMNRLLGVGICLPGLVDGSAGKIYTTFHRGWTEHDLSIELGERLGTRVVVENNVRARVICADLFDRSVTEEPFAYLFVSYGVACQMIIDGKVHYGKSAAAGEIGHTVVQRNGPVCPTCGNRGCLEALTGERTILQKCQHIYRSGIPTILREFCNYPEELTIDHVLKAQAMGDREVNLLLEDVMDYLGIALANIINTISPRLVMLDGKMFESNQNQAMLLRSVERNMFRMHLNQIRFEFLPYDPERGARGAAAVVVRELLLNSDI